MSAFFLYETPFIISSSYCNVPIMLKQKKYLLAAVLLIISMIIILSRVSLWEKQIYYAVKKKIEPKGWNLITGESSGNFMNTVMIKNILIENNNGEIINIDKISLNLGIISSLFGDNVFDLVAIEGLEFSYKEEKKSGGQIIKNNLSFDLPFHVKSLFVDVKVEALYNDENHKLELMLGGSFTGYKNPELNCDLVKVSIDENRNFVAKFNSLKILDNDDFYKLESIEGELFGLPIKGNISIDKKNVNLKGYLNVPKFSFPEELFSKTPLKTKFSNFTGQFNFESDFETFSGSLSVINEFGLDMRGSFSLNKNDDLWRLNNLSLSGENSNLLVNGIWEETERISCYMNLDNLDLSGWLKDQKPTKMSGLFIMDAGLTDSGALDLIDMTLEIVESKLFNQGEISIHGQLAYQDSILSTVDPVMLLVGDSYITIDGKGDFSSKEMNLYTDMEKADIDLINSFLPGNFVSGKATGNLKVYGNIGSPSATAELICENVNVSNFDLESIELNSQIDVIDNIPTGFIDIKADKGVWKDRSFESGTVSALIEDKAIKIENCHFKSGNDFLQLSGAYDGEGKYEIDRIQLAHSNNYLINARTLNFSYKDSVLDVQPFEFHINDGMMDGVISSTSLKEGRFKMSNFDAEILTQFIDDDRLKFSGLIFGEIWISLDKDQLNIDTDLSLKKGSYMDEAFDEMTLSCLYKNGILHIDDISMTRKGSMGLQASGIIPIIKRNNRRSSISLSSNFSNLSLTFIHRFIPKFFEISGNGTGNLNLTGSLDSTQFQYDVNIMDASFDLIKLGKFNSKGYYDGRIFNIKEASSISKEGKITASGKIPFDLNLGSSSFGKLFDNEVIDLIANANLRTLPFLSPYISDLDSAVGKFEIELLLGGNAHNFKRNGTIKVQDGSLHTLLLSDPINQIDGYAVMKDNQLVINNLQASLQNFGSGEVVSKKQNTEIFGKMDFSQFFNPGYNLSIKSQDASFQLLFFDISATSNLDLQVSGRDTVYINGMVETTEANVFYEFTTEDVGTVMQDEKDNILAYNLNIPIRGKSYFKNSQIYAEVIGELNLAQVGNQEVDFGGQIIVEDGSVFSYKDYFEKLQGIVSFDNKGFNPDIEVNAYTMIDNERIDLSIRGGIDDLDIILESGSGFSESDILELLTWGKRFEDQELTSTGFGNQTVSILGTLLENQLEKNLKESNIGMMNFVDDIDISGAAGLFQGANEDFEVTTKTKISDKTFLNLSYKRSFSLNQDQSQVGVEYKLNRHFSVVGNVDEEGKLNLKYRYRYAY